MAPKSDSSVIILCNSQGQSWGDRWGRAWRASVPPADQPCLDGPLFNMLPRVENKAISYRWTKAREKAGVGPVGPSLANVPIRKGAKLVTDGLG